MYATTATLRVFSVTASRDPTTQRLLPKNVRAAICRPWLLFQ